MDNIQKSQVIILAAGNGSRMNSRLAKPLHRVAGKAMIEHVLCAAKDLCTRPIVVVGRKGKLAITNMIADRCDIVSQREPLGTGDAVRAAKHAIENSLAEHIIVVPADHPLLTAETLKELCKVRERTRAIMSLATVKAQHFDGVYHQFFSSGRIIRNQKGAVIGVVELRDALSVDSNLVDVKEVNVSCYCFDSAWLIKAIDCLDTKNAAKEFYLTDLVRLAAQEPGGARAVCLENAMEGLGVNTQDELRAVEYMYVYQKQHT